MSGWRSWLWLGATVLGAAAFSVLVWWGGPLIGIGDTRPLDPVWLRALLVALVWLAVLGSIGWALYRRHKAAQALKDALTLTEEQSGDADVLGERMRDALATLRKVRGGKSAALYELPWYIIIGPPGAGKTTALVNSGLKFPLSRGSSPEAIAGIGGTRYCDWWFTEDAVLIDTAGRYTTQDSDAKSDRSSWLSFLDLLGKHRPKQPINGVIVAISLEDILTGTQEEVAAHASAIRTRLLELHDRLSVDFPVYALFTKADLVAGFTDFFGHLTENDRRMVWGHTFQTADKTRNMIGEVPAEFDALVERLNQWLPDRLQEEPTPTSRVVLFGFPSQMAAAKRSVVNFLTRIFEPSRYHVNATLRGFYFASGTQQGTPIDQLIGALSRSFGSEDVAASAFSGRGRSFFLNDLIRKVIIGEAGWVSINRSALRRANLVRLSAYSALALGCAVAVALWWTSYLRNAQLVAQASTVIGKYRGEATDVLREPTVADRDFNKVFPLLNTLRSLPAGYASRGEGVPLLSTFGLSQHARLASADEVSYHAGLERMFRPRLIFRLEEQLEANRANPSFIYEALKVYLMLGQAAPDQMDRDLVVNWMRRDWADNLYPGPGSTLGRQYLEGHLVAMLDLEPLGRPVVSINQTLVEDCQKILARLSVAERAYELLKSDAKAGNARDWVASRAGGPDAKLVFETVSGRDLDSIRVPFFYTYDGFYEAFIDRFADVVDAVSRDQWVLGAFGQQQAYTAQFSSLIPDLLKLYARDFAPTWTAALARLKLKPLASDKPKYEVLQAVAAPTSPLRQIIESLRDETRLTRERPTGRPGAGKPGTGEVDPRTGKAKALLTETGVQGAERLGSAVLPSGVANTASSLGRIALEGRGPGTGATGPSDRYAQPRNEAPGVNIEATFKPYHLLVEGDAGRRTVDTLIQNLNELKNAAIEATNPAQAAVANNTLVTQTRSLRALASRFPPPFEPMIRQIANEFEGSAAGEATSQLGRALSEQVIRDCQQITANRYPFSKGSDREIPIADFARLFAPNGIIDRFFTQNLAQRADRSKPQWTWRVDDQLARGLSAGTLRSFQSASEIRDAFFPTGGNMPALTLAVTPLTLAGDAARARLEVNGTAVVTQQGVNAPTSVQWPGPTGLGRTTITIETGGGGFFGGAPTQQMLLERNGAWSLFRVLDGGSLLRQGDSVVATLVAGGRELSYRFNVTSIQNPLVLPALREFRCPIGL